ncbi:MAG: hypothetical protein AB8G15_01885 [Saprospiraceae bacterium]
MNITPLSSITLRTYWVGGVEGAATDWNHPDNWSTREVPSSISDVIIPNVSKDRHPFPIITGEVRRIAHLEVCKHAKLILERGAYLFVEGSRTYENGISVFGTLINKGKVEILNAGRNCIEIEGGELMNQGTIFTDFPESEAIVFDQRSLFTQRGKCQLIGTTNTAKSYSLGR